MRAYQLSICSMAFMHVIKDHGSCKLLLEARFKICLHMMHMEIYLMAKTSDHKVDVCYLDTFLSAPTSCRT